LCPCGRLSGCALFNLVPGCNGTFQNKGTAAELDNLASGQIGPGKTGSHQNAHMPIPRVVGHRFACSLVTNATNNAPCTMSGEGLSLSGCYLPYAIQVVHFCNLHGTNQAGEITGKLAL